MIYLELTRKQAKKLIKALPKGKLRKMIKRELREDQNLDKIYPRGEPVTLEELAMRKDSDMVQRAIADMLDEENPFYKALRDGG